MAKMEKITTRNPTVEYVVYWTHLSTVADRGSPNEKKAKAKFFDDPFTRDTFYAKMLGLQQSNGKYQQGLIRNVARN
jgi:hypothetical protein